MQRNKVQLEILLHTRFQTGRKALKTYRMRNYLTRYGNKGDSYSAS